MKVQYIKEIEDKAIEIGTYKDLPISKDNHLYCILAIANSVYKNFLINEKKEKGLNQEVLKLRFGQYWYIYKDFLLEFNFIVLTRNYSAGNHANMYGVTIEKPTWKWRIFKESAATKKTQKYYDEGVSSIKEINTDIEMQITQMMRENINTTKKGWNIIGEWVRGLGAHPSRDMGALCSILFKESMPPQEADRLTILITLTTELYNIGRYDLAQIIDSYYSLDIHQIRSTVDNFGFRFHHNLSNMKKSLRKEITIDSEETCEIDLTASQIFFLAVTMKESGIVDEQFFEDVTSEDFYSFFSNGIISRDELKEDFFKTLLYSKLAHQFSFLEKHNKTVNLFKDKYSKTWDYLCHTKKYDRNTHEAGNTALAKRMQRTESYYMKNIWQILLELNIKFVPIHDAIVCKKKDVSLVVDVVKSVLIPFFDKLSIKIDGKQETILNDENDNFIKLLNSNEEQIDIDVYFEQIRLEKIKIFNTPKIKNRNKIEWDDAWLS